MSIEEWRPIQEFEGFYEISSLGRVRSIDRIVKCGQQLRQFKSKIMSPVSNGAGYLFVRLYKSGFPTKKEYVHRLVARVFLGLKNGDNVDHRNGDSLKNSVDDIRPCSRAQNMQNRKKDRDNKSGFKGVFQLPSGRFQAKITANGKRYTIGTFDSAEAAGLARSSAAKMLHGEFAHDG